MSSVIDQIEFDRLPGGLLPAVAQDVHTKDVLMLGFMNREALAKTLSTRMVTFWSRSRQKLWTKGETSGNILRFVSLRVNCENNSLLVQVEPVGPTCHTMHPTCYYREVTEEDQDWRVITEQQLDPAEVYGRTP